MQREWATEISFSEKGLARTLPSQTRTLPSQILHILSIAFDSKYDFFHSRTAYFKQATQRAVFSALWIVDNEDVKGVILVHVVPLGAPRN